MCKTKPIPSELLRLTGAAQNVLQLVQSGDLFRDTDDSRSRCVEAFDALAVANDAVINTFPKLALAQEAA